MQIPYTSNKLLFWLDPSEKFVTKDSNNQVISILNRAGRTGDNLMRPNTVAGLGPIWVANSLNGQPTLSFSGNQNLLFNMNDNAAPVGNNKPFMITTVVSTAVFGTKSSVPIMVGSKTISNPDQAIFATNQTSIHTYGHQRVNDFAQSGFSPGPYQTDSNYHVVTSAWDGVYLKLRVDGVEINSVNMSLLTSPCSMNQVSVGYIVPNKIATIGSFIDPFVGNIATALVYIGEYGTYIDYSIENYLMDFYNI